MLILSVLWNLVQVRLGSMFVSAGKADPVSWYLRLSLGSQSVSDMTTLLYANNAQSTLALPISSTATTAVLATGTGSLFPAPVSGQAFYLTFNDAATGVLTEIVLVTGMSGDVITTMVRAQQGTTAQSWSAGDFASQFFTAADQAAMAQSANLSILATASIPAPTVANTSLHWNGTAYVWA